MQKRQNLAKQLQATTKLTTRTYRRQLDEKDNKITNDNLQKTRRLRKRQPRKKSKLTSAYNRMIYRKIK